MARKKHLSVDVLIDDSVMNPDPTVPAPRTGSPVAEHLRKMREMLRNRQENEGVGGAIDDAGIEETNHLSK